jgi:hypothetical protein
MPPLLMMTSSLLLSYSLAFMPSSTWASLSSQTKG